MVFKPTRMEIDDPAGDRAFNDIAILGIGIKISDTSFLALSFLPLSFLAFCLDLPF